MNLSINANDTEGAQSVQIRYRILNSGSTYTMATVDPSTLPYVAQGVPAGQYEVGMRNLCSNGQYSPWVTGQTQVCPAPLSFAAILSGTNIAITATLTAGQSKMQIQVTDPNGGITLVSHDFGTGVTSGTFNIPINPTLYGNYSVSPSAVCDDTVTPVYASAFGTPVVVNYPNPTVTNTFNVSNTSPTNLYFNLSVDGSSVSGARGVSGNSSVNVVTTEAGTSTSDVSMEVTSGYAPSSAVLGYRNGSVNGVITGSIPSLMINFANIDLTATQLLNITLNP